LLCSRQSGKPRAPKVALRAGHLRSPRARSHALTALRPEQPQAGPIGVVPTVPAATHYDRENRVRLECVPHLTVRSS
jgi:hypothetical protein